MLKQNFFIKLSMTSKVICGDIRSIIHKYNYSNLILSKFYMHAKIIKTQIYFKKKFDLKGHLRSKTV